MNSLTTIRILEHTVALRNIHHVPDFGHFEPALWHNHFHESHMSFTELFYTTSSKCMVNGTLDVLKYIESEHNLGREINNILLPMQYSGFQSSLFYRKMIYREHLLRSAFLNPSLVKNVTLMRNTDYSIHDCNDDLYIFNEWLLRMNLSAQTFSENEPKNCLKYNAYMNNFRIAEDSELNKLLKLDLLR